VRLPYPAFIAPELCLISQPPQHWFLENTVQPY
jgi:hypothetical protein